jgi:hypothetical protein
VHAPGSIKPIKLVRPWTVRRERLYVSGCLFLILLVAACLAVIALLRQAASALGRAVFGPNEEESKAIADSQAYARIQPLLELMFDGARSSGLTVSDDGRSAGVRGLHWRGQSVDVSIQAGVCGYGHGGCYGATIVVETSEVRDVVFNHKFHGYHPAIAIANLIHNSPPATRARAMRDAEARRLEDLKRKLGL